MPSFVDYLTPGRVQTAATAFQAAAGGDWSSAVATIGRESVSRITFRSQLSPPLSVDPFAPQAAGPPNPILALIRPEVTVETRAGSLVMAPYGTPSANYLPWLILGVLVTGIGIIVGIGYIARRLA